MSRNQTDGGMSQLFAIGGLHSAASHCCSGITVQRCKHVNMIQRPCSAVQETNRWSWPVLLPYQLPAQTGCENHSYNSCQSLLHKSFPCLNSQGTKSDSLFVQWFSNFSISHAAVFTRHLLFVQSLCNSRYPKQHCSLGMNSPIGITIRPK